MSYTKKEREYYNEQRERACERLGITKNQYNWLRRKGEELHKSYEVDCNGGYPTEEIAEEVQNPIYNCVDSYVKPLGLFIYYQTDPRGATIYLDKEPIPENNYTRAVCIY
jgi:hypothetical protein